MRTVSRQRSSYRWLVTVLAADVMGLVALLLNQWLEAEAWFIWSFSAVAAGTSLPWLVVLADRVFEAAGTGSIIPLAGEKSP